MQKTLKAKKLTLARSTLRVLSSNDLRDVVGGTIKEKFEIVADVTVSPAT